MAIGEDVGRIEQLRMAQPAHGADLGVRAEHAGSEHRLVQPQLGEALDVRALRRRQRCEGGGVQQPLALVDGHRELAAPFVLRHQPHRQLGEVDTLVDADEVHQRQAPLHRRAQRRVVRVLPVGSAVLVADQSIAAEVVGDGGSWLGGVYVVRMLSAASRTAGFQMPVCTTSGIRLPWNPKVFRSAERTSRPGCQRPAAGRG